MFSWPRCPLSRVGASGQLYLEIRAPESRWWIVTRLARAMYDLRLRLRRRLLSLGRGHVRGRDAAMIDELHELEATMRRQRLVAYPSTSESDRLALPRMVDIYVTLCRDMLPGYVCTQERFLATVVAASPDLPSDGVRARASRTYPALVRQQHFAVALRTRTHLEGVHWIPELDYRGIDLLVLDHGR